MQPCGNGEKSGALAFAVCPGAIGLHRGGVAEDAAIAELYRENGFVVLRRIIPTPLSPQWRILAEEDRAIARRLESLQAHRLQPLGELAFQRENAEIVGQMRATLRAARKTGDQS